MNIKQQLNESMSSIAYHFCPIDALWAIMKSKKFRLTPSNATSADDREKCTIGNYTYPFYMCFSRSHSCLNGYVRRRLEGDVSWRKGIVRITVDGNKFNYNFKTVPVNVYSDMNDERVGNKFDKTSQTNKNIWFDSADYLKERKAAEANGVTNFPTFAQWKNLQSEKLGNTVGAYTFKRGDKNSGTLNRELTASLDKDSQFRQLLEFEDRLLSNEGEIPAFPYIKRIDILLTENGMKDTDMIQMVGDVLTRLNSYSYKNLTQDGGSVSRSFSLPIHIYDTISSFETNSNEMSPSGIIRYAERFGNINKQFLTQNASIVSKRYKPVLNESKLRIIATAISALISIECSGKREFKNLAKSLIREYGLNSGYLNGVNYERIIMNNLTFFTLNLPNQIKAYNTWLTVRNSLRGFTGELQKYANAVRQMYGDFMAQNNWKYKDFEHFQSGLRNRFKELTGVSLAPPNNEVQVESLFIKKLIINESQFYRLFSDKIL